MSLKGILHYKQTGCYFYRLATYGWL